MKRSRTFEATANGSREGGENLEKTLDRNNLESMLLVDLQGIAKEIGLTGIKIGRAHV